MEDDCRICSLVQSCTNALKLDTLTCIELANTFYAKRDVYMQQRLQKQEAGTLAVRPQQHLKQDEQPHVKQQQQQ